MILSMQHFLPFLALMIIAYIGIAFGSKKLRNDHDSGKAIIGLLGFVFILLLLYFRDR